MYRWIFAVTLALALGWTGLWFHSSSALKRDIAAWFEDRRADGWQAEYDSLSVRGFPSRLDATLTGLHIADPTSGFGWQAPMFQILGLTYRPGHQILVFPDNQAVTLPSGQVRITSKALRASLIHDAEGRVLRGNLEADSLRTDAPLPMSMMFVRAAFQEIAAQSAQYRFGIGARTVNGDSVREDLRLQAEVAFDQRWTMAALAGPRPRVQRLDLREGHAVLGGQELSVSGRIGNIQGGATGSLQLRAQDGAALLDILRPLLPLNWIESLEAADLTGPLDIPLIFDAGQMSPGEPPLP
ncbi:DUF2125 domain-containing protein [Mameliella alba]|nr:DUF2125 domain-containing protein [Mameliella alba]MBY6171468.1 DUF2125 domain-containing protein [Mameliella alba]MBY6176692.1 DUF2125 domain-containing protein [Mameliella alba]